MVRVRVRWFAALRERRGVGVEVLEVPEGTTLAALYESSIPAGPEGRLRIGYARNLEHVDGATIAVDGDEIVFLPPLGGG